MTKTRIHKTKEEKLLKNILKYVITYTSYKECARDKLVDRTPTCQMVRW